MLDMRVSDIVSENEQLDAARRLIRDVYTMDIAVTDEKKQAIRLLEGDS